MSDNPSYYAVIPASVRYDKRLTGKAILLYGEITALCNQKGYCWASDDYFAKLYGVTKMTVQNWLKSLERENYISREVTYKKDTKEIEHRLIRIEMTPTKKNLGTPTQKNFRDNTTSINKNHSGAETSFPIEDKIINSIINCLNEQSGNEYDVTSDTKELIEARSSEGFTGQNFMDVIKYMSFEWGNTDEMESFLRPKTLFGSKMRKYLKRAKAHLSDELS